jgi:crotonobetainyl-CoA:carnitine CoA-transferase CaiB-like acyl-CoA transferase
LQVLEEADVPAAPVLERDELFTDPQIQANDMLAVQRHSQAGAVDMVNIPVRLSDTPGSIRSPAPEVGQHTEEVLRELGYDDGEIARLRAERTIG